jgi:hypothetical protein
MYRYTVKPSIVSVFRPMHSRSQYPTRDWLDTHLKPLFVNEEYTLFHGNAFIQIKDFCFYSKEQLNQVRVNGYLFPLTVFDVTEY